MESHGKSMLKKRGTLYVLWTTPRSMETVPLGYIFRLMKASFVDG